MVRFGIVFRQVRRRLGAKQTSIAANVRCADASISYWEADKRLPSPRRFWSVIRTLRDMGASSKEIEQLKASYFAAVRSRAEHIMQDPDASE
jgi:hypothetical protein